MLLLFVITVGTAPSLSRFIVVASIHVAKFIIVVVFVVCYYVIHVY